MSRTRKSSFQVPKIHDGIHGGGAVLNRTSAGEFVLHEVKHSGTVREVGTFRRSVDAWRALDVLDTAGL